ncbi:MAG: 4-(cytidine 5'-diphospho)-2-C-methyl-D-erythritol kinase [Candidatus Aquicultorales bacterium]
MELTAYAKINLYLDVVGTLPGGYHAIESIMQSVSLCDELTIDPADKTEILCPSEPALSGVDNLAFRAHRLCVERFPGRVKPVRIVIAKRIPVAAGLGGGSADAAAVLVALNHLFDLRLDEEGLASLGASLGADVPFCLKGGTAVAEGKGERLAPLPPASGFEIVLTTPPFGLSTELIYKTADSLALPPIRRLDLTRKAVSSGDPAAVGGAIANRLQAAALYVNPRVEEYLDTLESTGALGVAVTGSGPTVFGIFKPGSAETAAESMRRAFPDAFTALALPVQKGVEF